MQWPIATDANEAAAEVVRRDLEYMGEALASELKEMAGSRLLITGGAGFLGYYLVQAVIFWNREKASADEKIHLSVLDNFARGKPAWLREQEAAGACYVIEHDVTRPFPGKCRDFEYVIHGASIASPSYYRRFPIETMDANVNGLRAVLEAARQRRDEGGSVKGILFFSSSEIYGDPPTGEIPTVESYRGNVSCTGPRACYDESKRYGETLCVNFASRYGLPVTIARPFNNYGPGLKISDKRALPDFAGNIVRGEDIVLYSDGSPTRTFCYVADAVIGYYKVLVRGRPGEAYNIGVETPEISVAQLAHQVVESSRELFAYEGKVVHRSNPDENYLVDNPLRRCPSIRKAREELDYDPQVSVGEGIRRSLIWYWANRDGEDC